MYVATFEIGEVVAVLAPEDIADEDTISYERNAKTNAELLIYPSFEVWDLCEKDITTVTLLDLNSHEVALYGRVRDIVDSMDSTGRYCRRVVCSNEMDFLAESAVAGVRIPSDSTTREAVDRILQIHNSYMGDDDSRKFVRGHVSLGYYSGGLYLQGETTLKALQDLFVRNRKWEIRTRHENGINYFDAEPSFGSVSETPITIGNNLKDIKAAYSASNKLVTRILPLGGEGYDGTRLLISSVNDGKEYVDNAELVEKYGVFTKILEVSELYARSEETEEEAARQLMAIAEEEAEALGKQPVQITLSAMDLKKIGYDNYDSFAVGNSYMVICPMLKICEELTVTALTRKLAYPQNISLTFATPTNSRVYNVSSPKLSQQIADYNRKTLETINTIDKKQLEITQEKFDDRLDDLSLKKLTLTEYEEAKDEGTLDENTIYTVVDEETGEVEQYLGETHISTEGGGGEDEGIPYPQQADMVDDPDSVTGFAAVMAPIRYALAASWVAGDLTVKTDSETGSQYVEESYSAGYQRTGYIALPDSATWLYISSNSTTNWDWHVYKFDSELSYIGSVGSNYNTMIGFHQLLGAKYVRLTATKGNGDAVRNDSVWYRL